MHWAGPDLPGRRPAARRRRRASGRRGDRRADLHVPARATTRCGRTIERPARGTPAGRRLGRCWRRSRASRATPARASLHVRRPRRGPTAVAFLRASRASRSTSARRSSASTSRATCAPAVDVPDGVALTTLAERPDLVAGRPRRRPRDLRRHPRRRPADGRRRPRRVPGPRRRPRCPALGRSSSRSTPRPATVVGYASLYARPDRHDRRPGTT